MENQKKKPILSKNASHKSLEKQNISSNLDHKEKENSRKEEIENKEEFNDIDF